MAVVQLVEHQVVILGVAGSSPVSHPKDKKPGLIIQTWFFVRADEILLITIQLNVL